MKYTGFIEAAPLNICDLCSNSCKRGGAMACNNEKFEPKTYFSINGTSYSISELAPVFTRKEPEDWPVPGRV